MSKKRRGLPDDVTGQQSFFPIDAFVPKPGSTPDDLGRAQDFKAPAERNPFAGPKNTVAALRSGFDPAELIDRLAAASLDASAVDVDETSDLPRAGNVLEWVNDPKFCNQDPPVLTTAVETLLATFEDYCPRCTDQDLCKPETIEIRPGPNTPGGSMTRMDLRFPKHYNGDRKIVGVNFTLTDVYERVALLQDGLCKKCGGTRRDFQRLGLFHNPNECVIVAGQRSTKTTTVALAWSYVLHRFLCIAHPARRFGLPKGQYLETFFTAITAEQAYKTLWKQSEMVYDNAPWFKKFVEILKDRGRSMGVSLYERGKTFIAFPGKNIACYFGPPEGASQRGRTRFFGSVSEWGWFAKSGVDTKDKKRANEDDIYTALANSLLTIRSACNRLRDADWWDAPNALMFNEGSPFAEQDKGMRLIREGRDHPRVVCRHYSTFEFNPTITPEEITSPRPGTVEYMRDYLAIPPVSTNPFIEDPKSVDPQCVDKGRQRILNYSIQRFGEDFHGTARSYLWAQLENWPHDRFIPRVLCVDAGESQNSFALVLCSVDIEERTIVDAVIEVIPSEGQHVHFPSMEEKVIVPLCEKTNVRYVFSDRWQSTHLIQRVRMTGVIADKYSLRPVDFQEFKGRLLAGRLRLPVPEVEVRKLAGMEQQGSGVGLYGAHFPIARLILQAQTVRQVGQKVLKPINGTDDLFRALVLADYVCEKYRKSLVAEAETDAYGQPVSQSVGVGAGLSSPYAAMAGASRWLPQSGRGPGAIGASGSSSVGGMGGIGAGPLGPRRGGMGASGGGGRGGGRWPW